MGGYKAKAFHSGQHAPISLAGNRRLSRAVRLTAYLAQNRALQICMNTRGRTMSSGSPRNRFLHRLDRETITRLQLRSVALPLFRELEAPGKMIDTVFFVEEGIASMTTSFENGSEVETGMFGYESAVGLSGLMGVRHSLNRTFMQLPGHGYACSIQNAREEFKRLGKFHDFVLRYVQAQLTHSTQSAACNAIHSFEQRLARWLLLCRDRAQQEDLAMAQEFVSQMLGSTRSTISIAAARLKAKGLIDYRRGSIRILDGKGLEMEACECYRVVRDHLANVVHVQTGVDA